MISRNKTFSNQNGICHHHIGRKFFLLILFFTLITSASIQSASAEYFTNLRWDGYISQALIYTSDNNFFGESDDGVSTEFTEVEFLFSAGFLNDFQFSGSILSRRAGESDDGNIRLDHGFVTYTMINDINWTFGARVGRIKAPLGFYGETRDIAFTRPSILAPQQLYPEFGRGLMFTVDGVELHGQRNWDINSVSWQIAMSKKDPDIEDLEDIAKLDLSGEIDSNISGAARVMYDWDAGRIRTALSYGRLSYNIYQGALGTGNAYTSATTISTEYNENNWQLVGEFSLTNRKITNIAPYPSQDTDGLTYYLQGIYRINNSWEILVRRGYLYINKDDKSGTKYEQESIAAAAINLIPYALPSHTQYAKNWVFGTGWHVSNSFLLRAEYQIIDGTAWVPADDALISPSSVTKDWDMFMFQASYRF